MNAPTAIDIIKYADIGITATPPQVLVLAAIAPKTAFTDVSTAETQLFSLPLPPLGPNDAVDVRLYTTATGGTHGLRCRLNGVSFSPLTNTAAAGYHGVCQTFFNRGATNAQMGSPSAGGEQAFGNPLDGDMPTFNVDTSVPTTLTVNGYFPAAGSGANIATLERVEAILRRGT